MYRSVGMENSGSPYNLATATWSTTTGMDTAVSCPAAGSSVGEVGCVMVALWGRVWGVAGGGQPLCVQRQAQEAWVW